MASLFCEGCNNDLDNCTCNVLTTKKEQTEKLKLIEIYDPCIPCEKEHNGECFDMECHSNARYNAKVSGAKLQMESDQLVVDSQQARIKELEAIEVSHRKLNGKLRERIKELEEEAEINDAVINMHWEADMRAVKLWREEHPERKMILPDQTNLVTWLLGQMELIPTKDEAGALLQSLESYVFCLYGNKKLPDWATKLQKIAGQEVKQ